MIIYSIINRGAADYNDDKCWVPSIEIASSGMFMGIYVCGVAFKGHDRKTLSHINRFIDYQNSLFFLASYIYMFTSWKYLAALRVCNTRH